MGDTDFDPKGGKKRRGNWRLIFHVPDLVVDSEFGKIEFTFVLRKKGGKRAGNDITFPNQGQKPRSDQRRKWFFCYRASYPRDPQLRSSCRRPGRLSQNGGEGGKKGDQLLPVRRGERFLNIFQRLDKDPKI